MLSISQPLKGAGAGNYYLKLAREDYYANRAEEAGRWAGGGAAQLGLTGEVSPESFLHLLNGYSPDGARALVQNAGDKDRQSGWDLTFSPEKSFSVLYGQTAPRPPSHVMLDCHRQAVLTAVKAIEQEAGITRRGKGGAIKERASLVFATFLHLTSRAQDPQIHTHVILVNLGFRADGTTGTLDSRNLFRMKMRAGAIYQRELARLLTERLGLGIEPRKVAFRIAGVPDSICRLFSKRRQSIERLLKERGRWDAISAKAAALATRPHKERVAANELFARWQRIGAEFGWGQTQAMELLQLAAQGRPAATPTRPVVNDDDLWHGLPDWKPSPAQAEGAHAASSKAAAKPARRLPRSHDPRRKPKSVRTRPASSVKRRRRIRNRAVASVPVRETELWPHLGGPGRQKRAGARGRVSSRSTRWLQAAWRRAFSRELAWSLRPILDAGSLRRPKFQSRRAKIYWRRGFILGELRLEMRKLFPHAPRWSPFRHLALPSFRMVLGHRQAPAGTSPAWRNVLWERSVGGSRVRLQRKRLFPRAPAWSPAHAIELPVVRVVQRETTNRQDFESRVQRQRHSHSH